MVLNRIERTIVSYVIVIVIYLFYLLKSGLSVGYILFSLFPLHNYLLYVGIAQQLHNIVAIHLEYGTNIINIMLYYYMINYIVM